MQYNGMILGIFIQEKNNRFLCDVLINGVVEECYVPSSCHLSHFIDLHGESVLLKHHKSKNARTKYSLYALLKDGQEIPLDLEISNRVVEAEIKRRLFSALGNRQHIKKETLVRGYKCDLFIEDTNTIIEVKSILSMERFALFPTIKSERSTNQLLALRELLFDGYSVFYYFVSLCPKVKQIGINCKYDEYRKAFEKCVDAGMKYDAFSVSMLSGHPSITKRLSIMGLDSCQVM